MHGLVFFVPITLFICTAATIILVPVARAYGRRMDRDLTRPGTSHELTSRLERMEQAIDSIAVEVERISEGQRFTTKLLAERAAERAPVAELPARADGRE